MPHVALPASDESPKPAQHRIVNEPAKAGAISKTGPILYVIKVEMSESGFCGMSFLHHYRQFTQEELDKMIAEAVRITNEIRIVNRRKEMAATQQPITDPLAINRNLFRTDCDFFEAVMSDKYEFDIVRGNVATARIEPTIKGV